MYPLFQLSAPANLGLVQAVMRKISTFELIDDSILKKHLWKTNEEEVGIDHFLVEAGIDSRYFMFTFGLPLYILAFSLVVLIILGVVNALRDKECLGRLAVGDYEVDAEDLEGGESDEEIKDNR